MSDIEKSCCFTGHRPKHYQFGADESHPDCVKIKDFIHNSCKYLIAEKGVVHFISGGALGVDTWAMEEVLSLKKAYPAITLECALPYAGMSERFSHIDRQRHDALITRCDVVTVVCPEYTGRACLDKRNEHMVDHARYLIAVWLGIMSGTGRTVKYAERHGREIFRYDPKNLKQD